ncbi:MAG: c-type cytochrome biogenesis protein CcmI [Burkholderiales bacterium]|nr:c-type cytochrome biogenesis protein CcmI [Burkholderiales bacterium]
MIAFWTICGILILIALLFVLTPLLRRKGNGVERNHLNISLYQQQLNELETDRENALVNEAQYEQGRQEIQKRLLEDISDEETAESNPAGKKTALVLGIAIPVLSVLLYLQLGHSKFLGPQEAPPEAAADNGGFTQEKIETMVAKLAARLQKNPSDAEGWTMLGRSYMILKRFPDAVDAFDHASKLLPNDAQVLAEYGESEMMTDPTKLNPKAVELTEKALKIDPNNPKALTLGGAIAFEQKNYARVVMLWENLLAQLQPDSEDAKAVENGIAGAREAAKASGKPLPESKLKPRSAMASVSGTVTLAPEFASKISPKDTLFIFARASSGPRMPLAILKVEARELPLKFSLDDTLAVAPMMKLSNFREVVVGARISKSGNAMPQSGDLEGLSQPVKVGAGDIHITIDKPVP